MIRELAISSAALLSASAAGLGQTTEIEAALDCFVTSIEQVQPSCHNSRSARYILTHGSEDEIEQVLSGLESMAFTAESKLVRISAANAIGDAGAIHADGQVVATPRLVRLYEESDVAGVRLSAMQQIARQPDQEAAAEFLGSIADDESEPGFSESSYQLIAVDLLAAMGPSGVAALQHLYQTDRIVEPLAKARSEAIRASGWVIPQ